MTEWFEFSAFAAYIIESSKALHLIAVKYGLVCVSSTNKSPERRRRHIGNHRRAPDMVTNMYCFLPAQYGDVLKVAECFMGPITPIT